MCKRYGKDDDKNVLEPAKFSPFSHPQCFRRQVRNAQHIGASGVLIADDTCLCSDKVCMANSEDDEDACQVSEPIMSDDGSGADISIPSFLMFKMDSERIIEEVKSNRPVQVEMAWSLPNPDDRVEYDLYTSPTDSISKSFIQSFKQLAVALGGRAYFTPHMYIFDGIKSQCHGSDGESHCHTLCTNNGRYAIYASNLSLRRQELDTLLTLSSILSYRYCATDPDGDLERGISGADVVTESLRRICIWNHYGAPNGIGEIWWDYVIEFEQRCAASDYFSDTACIQEVYHRAQVDGDMVERCMTDSGGTIADGANTKLDFELNAQTDRGVVILPTTFVNTAAIHGALTPSNVFNAVCAGFADGTAPESCNTCSSCKDTIFCVGQGYCKANDSSGGPAESGVSGHAFATSMLIVIGCFSTLGAWYYKRTKDELREHVRGIMAEYMPLDDNEGDLGNPMDFSNNGDATTSLMMGPDSI